METKDNYIKRNWATFPVNNDKTPKIPSWKVNSKVGFFGEGDFAIDCGKSQILVVDIDIKGNKKGDVVWANLTKEYGINDATRRISTRSGGKHYIYHYEGNEFKNTIDLFPGIDIKTVGGYVVAPPSKGYEYLDGDVLELPEELRNVLITRQRAQRFFKRESRSDIPDGMRHKMLAHIAGMVWNESRDVDALFERLTGIDTLYCKPSLGRKEIETLVNQAVSNWESRAEIPEPDKRAALLEQIYTTKYCTEKDPPPVDWVISGVIEAGGVMIIFGDSGLGNTFGGIHLATQVSSGGEWYGNPCKPKTVIYLEGENGKSLMHRRSRVVDPEGVGNIHYLSFPGIICDKNGLETIEWLINELGAGLMVIDPLMRFIGGDENTVEDIKPQLGGLRDIANRTNCTLLLLHQENKQKGYRGSSAFKYFSTLMLHMKNSKKYNGKDGENVLDIIPIKKRESTLKEFTMVWKIEGSIAGEGGEFVACTLADLKKAPLDRIVKACGKIYEKKGEWPGKSELAKAKGYHGIGFNDALKQIEVGYKERLDLNIDGRKHIVSVRDYKPPFAPF